MSEKSNLKYAALITLSLPGEGEQVSLTVTLWPEDFVDVDGILKSLGECTLTDLEQYARELEADVWDTYESIVLPELEASGSVGVEVELDDRGVDLPHGWQGLRLQLPGGESAVNSGPEVVGSDKVEQAAAAAIESADAETGDVRTGDLETVGVEAGDVELTDVKAGDGEAGREQPGEETEDEEMLPDVAVSETESVYPEIEEEVEEEGAAPAIVPSQARVRVAGARRPLNDPTWAAVDILLDEPALRQAQAHAMSSLSREVAGVLVGRRPEKQPDGRYVVHVFDTIMAKYTVMQGASVTYTPESWRYLNDTLQERYPDETAVMVGWYHTHPGFGIFLSGMDLFIHQNFFTQVWHIAYVLDPRARTSGFFCWDRAKMRVERYDFQWPSWATGSW